MYPVLFRIGDFEITSFGLMMFLSFISAAWVLSIQLRRRNLNPDFAWDVLVWAAVGGIAGAKLYYLALHWGDVVADPIGSLTSRGGLVWYGGLIGGIIAYYLAAKRHMMPLARTFDSVAPALMLAYAVGRMGCFLVGDDYGLPTDAWYGVAFPNGAPPSTAGYLRTVGGDIPASVPDTAVIAVHPTQIYEVVLALILFGVLWKLAQRDWRPGKLFAAYLAFYAVERFMIEFVRAKGDRIFLGLSTSQAMSFVLLAAAAVLWTRNSSEAPPAATVRAPRTAAKPRKV